METAAKLSRLQWTSKSESLRNTIQVAALCVVAYCAAAIAVVYGVPPYFVFAIPLVLLTLIPSKAIIGLLLFLVATSAWLPYSSWDFTMGSAEPYLSEWQGGWRNVLVGPALMVAPIVVLWILGLMVREYRLLRSHVFVVFGLFIGANLISAAWNFETGGAALRHLVAAITLYALYAAVFFVVAGLVADPRRDGRLTALGLLAAGAVAVTGTIAVMGVGFWQSGWVFWKSSPICTANLWMGFLGGFGCVGALTAVAGTLETRSRIARIPLLAVALASVLIVLLAWQRALWVALVVGLVSLLLVRSVKSLLVFLIVIGVVAVLFAPAANFVQRVFVGGELEGMASRYVLWQEGLDVWKQSPLLGIGPGQYLGTHALPGPHNQYVAVMAESGLLGLLPFVALMVLLLKEGVDAYKTSSDPLLKACALGLVGVLAGLAVSATTSEGIMPTYGRSQVATFIMPMYFWVLAGLTIGLRKRARFDDGAAGQLGPGY